jgi:antitoxin (DNA-binding transcriptional repressor) of toxin-antitoxin stability system
MHQVDINQAREQISMLLRAALNGDEIIFTQDNRPVLKLVRVEQRKRRQSGSAKGQIQMSDDFDEPLDDFKEYS